MNTALTQVMDPAQGHPYFGARPTTPLRLVPSITRAEPRPDLDEARPSEELRPPEWRWPMTSGFPEIGAYLFYMTSIRSHVRETLSAWHLTALAEPAQLIASELGANAIKACADPETIDAEHPQGLPQVIDGTAATIAFRLRSNGVCLLIEVWDPVNPQDGMPTVQDVSTDGEDEIAESGRGLFIVDMLAEEWGCDQHAGGGKVTWALLKKPMDPGPGDPVVQPAA